MEPGTANNLATLDLVALGAAEEQTTVLASPGLVPIDLWNISMPVTVVFWGSRIPRISTSELMGACHAQHDR